MFPPAAIGESCSEGDFELVEKQKLGRIMTEMRTFRLDKLVRDGILQSTVDMGGSAWSRKLKGKKLTKALFDKLDEEMKELKTGSEPDLEKLADVREVIEALAVNLGHTVTELHAVQYDKKGKIGGFAAGIYIDTVTLPEDTEMADYYASDPDRFPEIK